MGDRAIEVALRQVRAALADVRLPLAMPGREDARRLMRAYAAQLDDYIVPRLHRQDAPLLAVISGSTGAGKSTLVNSVVGRVVSAAGVIRPTTLSPVLVHNPADTDWFMSDNVLPGLARSTRPGAGHMIQLVADDALPAGLAFVDAPDVDSVVAENRALASQLLAAADLWMFVTTAARYADAVPWDFLCGAAEREAVVAVVLDRVPEAAMDVVPEDLQRMMRERGLGSSPMFVVPETVIDHSGLLAPVVVEPIRHWLADLARDAQARAAVADQTLRGAIAALVRSLPAVADAVDEQAGALWQLREDAEAIYREQSARVAEQTANGVLMRGEVLARWQDFVGTGEFFRVVEQRISWLHDRVVGALRGEPKQVTDVQVAVETGLDALIREAGVQAARRVASTWEANPAGRELLGRLGGELSRPSRDFAQKASQVVRLWQSDVLTLVTQMGAAKRTQARVLALGVNGVGVALMILVFSQTGGLLGAEIGIAGGTAVLAQRLLEAVFGEEAVRRLAKQAKGELDARVEGLLAEELSRYLELLDHIDLRPDAAAGIRTALRDVTKADMMTAADKTGDDTMGEGRRDV